MPWQARGVLQMKEDFIEKLLSSASSMSALCKEFNISRKTGYKWINKFQTEGVNGLLEYSRRPHSHPNRISSEPIEVVLQAREKFPAWGARKIRQYLINEGHFDIPSESTVNRILMRNGKIDPIESQKRQPYIRFEKESPNELWQMDFKGHFGLIIGRCHPLTVLDDHSRFSIVLKALEGETTVAVRLALEEAFREYGLPERMTMDNGSPWKGKHPWVLSQLTIWLMRLGIQVSHSSVGHPQTQGKDERFHRSLKEEVLKFHQFRNLEESQKKFDEWRYIYNFVRPHQGINLLRPFERYRPSTRSYPEKLPEIQYEPDDIIRKVQSCGTISFSGVKYFVGEHLRGENVAIRQLTDDGKYGLYFVKTKLIEIKPK